MMDYKYIEQLLDRYWQAETSPAEESILRAFFCQADVPAHLRQYAPLFATFETMQSEHVSDDFEARVLARIAAAETAAPQQSVKAVHLTPLRKLTPLLRAAAIVAIVVLIGDSARRAAVGRANGEQWQYNTAYTETYSRDAGEACEALQKISESLPLAVLDSVKKDSTRQKQ